VAVIAVLFFPVAVGRDRFVIERCAVACGAVRDVDHICSVVEIRARFRCDIVPVLIWYRVSLHCMAVLACFSRPHVPVSFRMAVLAG